MGAPHPDPFAEQDALRTERNAAVAEAKLWLRRVLQANKERDLAKRNFYECNKCLDEWIAAYDDLLRNFRRLEVAHQREVFLVDTGDFLIEQLKPLAMAQLQRLIDEAPK